MYKYYSDYFWKSGKPYGINPVDPAQSHFSYKIVIDPYFKRISIEKYAFNSFEKVVYDSIFLDFRRLTAMEQAAWQREILSETEFESVCLLRNQEDRAVLIERITFDQQKCRSCTTYSIHELPVATHRMYYKELGDSFNGVILFDLEGHPVIKKSYEIDAKTGEFTNLLTEEWEMMSGVNHG